MESAAILCSRTASSSSLLRCCFGASPSSCSSSTSAPSSHANAPSRFTLLPPRGSKWGGNSRASSAQTQLKLLSVLENGNGFTSPRLPDFSRRRHLRVEAVNDSSILTNETVIPGPSYRIPIVLLGAAGAFLYADNYFAAVPIGLLGLLLLVQTTRVRFIFTKDALEVKLGDELKDSGENVFVGGKNFWKFSTFTNWELWWPSFPILVYFKETQTKPEGQIHFFPLILDGKKVYDLMVQRAGPSKTSGPK